jgi:hypothetical protein
LSYRQQVARPRLGLLTAGVCQSVLETLIGRGDAGGFGYFEEESAPLSLFGPFGPLVLDLLDVESGLFGLQQG